MIPVDKFMEINNSCYLIMEPDGEDMEKILRDAKQEEDRDES